MTGRSSALCLTLGILLLAASAALLLHNRQEVRQAQRSAELLLAQTCVAETDAAGQEQAAQEAQPEELFAVLSVPALALELPVLPAWSEAELTRAPCRQQGSAEEGGLVIAGHNYASHFGSLSHLSAGDAVTLSAADGAVYRYAVVWVEQVAADDTDTVLAAVEPLVLYTCTYGGQARIAVFCIRDQD